MFFTYAYSQQVSQPSFSRFPLPSPIMELNTARPTYNIITFMFIQMKPPLSAWHCLWHLMVNRNWLKHHHPPRRGLVSYQRRVSDRALIWFHLLFGHCSEYWSEYWWAGMRNKHGLKVLCGIFFVFRNKFGTGLRWIHQKISNQLGHITTMFRFQLFLVFGFFINKLVRPYSAYLFLVNKTFFLLYSFWPLVLSAFFFLETKWK